MKPLNSQNNFVYLFISLILFLFTAAVVAEFSNLFSKEAFSLIIILMMLAGFKSLQTRIAWKRTLYVLIPLFVVLSALDTFFNEKIYLLLVLTTLLLFFIGCFVMAFRQVLFVGDIDGNKIIGSLTLYILIGLIWAVIYMLIISLDPTAFSGLEVTNWKEGFSRFAYYSFVTLTTLGYGDILPANHIAEFFISMEAILGVFYIAIIVSSLISLRISAVQEQRRER